jgi:glycosyltransferase involved in cell wall biosynthesis
MLSLFTHPEIGDRLASAGLALVRKQFSIDAMVTRYRRLYQSVLA